MVTVRDARQNDIDTLVDFSLRMGLESEGRAPDEAVVRNAAAAAVADPRKARYFVAEADGHVVGSLFVTYEWSDWTSGWYWWIQGAFVAPGSRQIGVFRALYEAVHAAARKEGDVRRVRLYVHEDNARAITTYHRLGMAQEPYRIFDASVTANTSP